MPCIPIDNAQIFATKLPGIAQSVGDAGGGTGSYPEPDFRGRRWEGRQGWQSDPTENRQPSLARLRLTCGKALKPVQQLAECTAGCRNSQGTSISVGTTPPELH